jgi:hypothetical protein
MVSLWTNSYFLVANYISFSVSLSLSFVIDGDGYIFCHQKGTKSDQTGGSFCVKMCMTGLGKLLVKSYLGQVKEEE